LKSDLYLSSFELTFWLAVIFSVAIGTTVIIFLKMVLQKYTEETKGTASLTYLYFGLEAMCNQSSGAELKNVSFRIASFSLRIISILSIAAYGAVITSFLTIKIPKEPFSNASEFRYVDQHNLTVEREKIFYRATGFEVLYLDENFFNQNSFSSFLSFE
jgi:hypothetical protein